MPQRAGIPLANARASPFVKCRAGKIGKTASGANAKEVGVGNAAEETCRTGQLHFYASGDSFQAKSQLTPFEVGRAVLCAPSRPCGAVNAATERRRQLAATKALFGV